MRAMHMTILALAVTIIVAGTALNFTAEPVEACSDGKDRIIIVFPGLGTLVIEGMSLDRPRAEQQFVEDEMREVAEMAYAMFSSQEEGPENEAAAVWTDVNTHGMNPEPQSMAQSEAPWDPASYVVWCMFVHMENVAKAQHENAYQ